LIAIATRLIVYVLLALAVVQLILFDIRSNGGAEGAFSEFGPVQITQSVLLALGALATIFAGRGGGTRFPLLANCLALVFTMLFIRENDQVLELWLPHGVWKWPALVLALALLVYLARHWSAALAQLKALSETFCYGVFLLAFTTLVFSRLFGSGSFWELLMQERYWRPVKNAVEEGTELLALTLLTAAAVEFFLLQRRRA